MKEAPLFAQAFDVAAWIQGNVKQGGDLGDRIRGGAIDLLDHVVLALKDVDRDLALERADVALVLLRVHVRLAVKIGLVEERQMVFLAGELDSIGRQIGGWQRRLAEDTAGGHHR